MAGRAILFVRFPALAISLMWICTTANVHAAEPALKLVFACTVENDLYKVLAPSGKQYRRYATAAEAIGAAQPGVGVLVLADGYPEKTTPIRRLDY